MWFRAELFPKGIYTFFLFLRNASVANHSKQFQQAGQDILKFLSILHKKFKLWVQDMVHTTNIFNFH